MRRRGLDCVPFLSAEPIRSLYGFETCARLWFYLFHYSFIGLLRPRTTKLSLCDNHEGVGREHFVSFSTTLTARIQFVFWNEKSVSSAGVDLCKWHSYTRRTRTWAESHVHAHTYILRRQLATPLSDVYLNEIASDDKMPAIDKNRIFLLHFSCFICARVLDILPCIDSRSTDSVTFCSCFIYDLFIFHLHTTGKVWIIGWWNKTRGFFFKNDKNKKFVPCWNSSGGGPWVVGLLRANQWPGLVSRRQVDLKIAPSEKSAWAWASQWGHSVGLVKRTSASEARVSPFSEGTSALKACQGTRGLERESKLASSPSTI